MKGSFKHKNWQRFIASKLVALLLFSLMPSLPVDSFLGEETAEALEELTDAPTANAQFFAKSAEETYGIVAILVDKNLLDDDDKYEGLDDLDYSGIAKSTIKKRIERYADDIQGNGDEDVEKRGLEYTKAMIIGIDPQKDSIHETATMLERLYFDGDAEDEQNHLVGVVLVGDLPLPVVNKNGNRFVSMLPYTDFDEKSYIYNAKTGDYEKDDRVTLPKVEVWHGVIRAPEELNGVDRMEALAAYLDKNHLYHTGHEDFADFDRSILLSDLYHERELMNTGFFKYYEKFIENAEDMAYFRMNKHWAEDLYKEFVGEIKEDAGDVMTDQFKQSLEQTKGMFANLPDIQSNQAVISKYHMPYIKLFTRFMAEMNDWINYTGRYEGIDAQSIPELIAVKDVYTHEYLKQVNTAYENQIDKMINKVQKHIPIVSYTNVTGNLIVDVERQIKDSNDDDNLPDKVTVEYKLPLYHRMRQSTAFEGGLPDESNLDAPLFNFLNHSLIDHAREQYPNTLAVTTKKPPVDPLLDAAANAVEEAVEMYTYPDGETTPYLDIAPELPEVLEQEVTASLSIANADKKLHINGLQADAIKGPLDCSLYRGSTQMTKHDRMFNVNNAGEKLFLGLNTRPFLGKKHNYEYGVVVTKDPYQAVPAVINGSPADTSGIKEGDIILEVNGEKISKADIDGSRVMLEDIIPRLNPSSEKTITIKYYSIAQKKEVSTSITLEDVNIEKWSAGCHGTNALKVHQDGSNNVNKCVSQLAKIPLFDAAAGVEIKEEDLHSGENIDEAHIRSCYDFYYNEEPLFTSYSEADGAGTSIQPFVKWLQEFKTFNSDVNNKYKNPTKKFEPTTSNEADASYHSLAKDIVMFDEEFDGKSYKVMFTDILDRAGAFDGIDNDGDGEVDEEDENDVKYAVDKNDWAEIGQRVLSRKGTFKFELKDLDAELEITISPEIANWVSSMIPHKEPVNSTIGAQAKAMASEALPIDSERYIAFLDKNGVMQKINYPNIFDANDDIDFKVQLFKLAQQIEDIPGSNNLKSSECSKELLECLVDELNATMQIDEKKFKDALKCEDDNPSSDVCELDELGHKMMAKTRENKLNDAIFWRNLGIDDKHSYVLQSYLNPAKDAYVDERGGYEALYLVSNGQEDFASFGFYGDFEAEKLDVELAPGDGSQFGGIGSGLTAEEDDEVTYNPPLGREFSKNKEEVLDIWIWFPEIMIWIEETVNSVTQIASGNLELNPSCAVDQSYDIIDAIQDQVEPEDKKIAKLELELEKDLLRSNGQDSAKLIVKSLNKSGQFLKNDSLTRVQILFAPEGQKALAVNSETGYMAEGVAVFDLKSTSKSGKVTVQIRTINTPQVILSEPLEVTTTKRNVQLNFLEEVEGLDAEGNIRTNLQATNQVIADGESELIVKASLIDDDGITLVDSNGPKVVFSIEQDGDHASLEKEVVSVRDGVAQTTLKSTKKAGLIKVKAEVKNSIYSPSQKDILVAPGPLHHIAILPDSNLIKAGGISYTPVQVRLEDQYNNLKNNEIFEMTLWHDGPGEFKNIADQKQKIPGVQVTVPEGVVAFNMSSTEKSGDIKMHAEVEIPSILPDERANDKFYQNSSISSRHDIVLSASAKNNVLKADGESSTVVEANLQGRGDFKGANLPVSFAISQENLAEFTQKPAIKLLNGKAAANVKAKTTSGEFSVVVSSPGFEDVVIPIEVKPLEPYAVQLIEPDESLVSDNQDTLIVGAQILDKYGNFVYEDASTKVDFSIKKSSQNIGQILSSSSLLVQGGKANATLKSTYLSGPIKLRAKANGLAFGDEIEINSEKRLPSENFASSTPDVLFASLIGNSFGNVTKKNIASSMLFSGWQLSEDEIESSPGLKMSTTQSISANTSPIEQFKTLFSVDSSGAAKLFDDLNVKVKYSKSDSALSSDRTSFIDAKSSTLLAEAAVVLPINSAVQLGEPHNKPGVYLHELSENELYEFKEDDSDYVLIKDEIPQIRFESGGRIKVLEGSYRVEAIVEDAKYLSFELSDSSGTLAKVAVVPQQGLDVNLVEAPYRFDSESKPGAYFIQHTQNTEYKLKDYFSGNSTSSPKAYAMQLTSELADVQQRIGGPHASTEAGFDKQGLGFTGQNKHMLLFFSGNTVGESLVPYASESGIILGDPTVRLQTEGDADVSSGFTNDLGQSIYTGQESIQAFKTFDYNSDGVDDVLVSYEGGKVRLLEGLVSDQSNPFRDKGYLLDLVNGIFDIDVGDFNNDGQDDIVVSTRESCHQGETCIYWYENDNGHFTQHNAGLLLEEKVSDFEVSDMDEDGFDDLVVADLNRNVFIFYGMQTGLNVHGQSLGGLQAEVDEGLNSAHQTFISYTRSVEEKAKIKAKYGFDPFIPMALPSNNPTDSAGTNSPLDSYDTAAVANLVQLGNQIDNGGVNPTVKVTAPPVKGVKLHEFLPLDRDLRVDKSVKKAKDLNGDAVKGGDELEYTITIFNSGNSIFNASILDYMPDSFEFVTGSIDCDGCSVDPQIINTGMPTRPYLVSGFNIDKNKVVKISYKMRAAHFPPLELMLGTGFDDYPEDGILDVLAFPENTPTNRVVFYSDGKNAQGKIRYTKKFPKPVEAPEPIDTDPPDASDVGFEPPKQDENGNPDLSAYQGINEDTSSAHINSLLPNDQAKKELANAIRNMSIDIDLDQIPGVNEYFDAPLGEVADFIQAGIAALKCAGGCIPSPINMTIPSPFPVPGKLNIFGVPGPFIPGIPIFSVNNQLAPPVINTPIWPFGNPFYFDSSFRMYFATTLTGGMGTAFCLGNYAWTEADKANSCFIFAIPLLQAIGVCDAIIGAVEGAFNSIEEGLQSASGHTTVIVGGSNPAVAQDSNTVSGFSSGPYPVKASVATNIRIPGFPSVIVNWLDRQTEELVDKLTDLPDIYLITPSVESLKNSVLPQTDDDFKVSNLHDIYTWLNSIPLLTIEQKPVPIKIPWLYEDQIHKTIRQYTQWVNDIKRDWEEFKKYYKCDTSKEENVKTLCGKLNVKVGKLVAGVEQNIQALHSYLELPKKLLTFRHLEARYVRQLICYMDTITQYLGGYMEKQGERIAAWVKAIDQVKRALETWKVIIDVVLTYAESCDSCKNDRFSLLEVMMKIMVVIPDPPIIELPKWPDIVLDVSKVQAGLKVVMPDFVFQPEPLIIPPPPKFKIPRVPLPQLNVQLPTLPALPVIPNVDAFLPEVPNLPPLPLPTLPDLPPPPKIPEIPKPAFTIAKSLDAIFRILCLVKQGLIPLPEPEVATEIETLTQRGLNPLLPIDMSLSFELPPISYTYLDQIEIIGKINFQVDVDYIYEIVKDSAEVINAYTSYGMNYTNQKLAEGVQFTEAFTSDITDNINKVNEYVPKKIDIEVELPGNQAGPNVNDATKPSGDGVNVDISSFSNPNFEEQVANLFGESVSDFETSLVAYSEAVREINEYSRSLPEQIVVSGSTRMVDTSHPLFDHSVEDVKARIAEFGDSEKAPKHMLAMRDQLIAYHDSLNEGTAHLEHLDSGEFMRFIVSNDTSPLVADNSFSVSGDRAAKFDFIPSDQNILDIAEAEVYDAKNIQERLIALTDEGANNAKTHGAVPKGMFIYDDEKNINHSLISYTAEIGTGSHLTYFDADQDGDEDILYSFAGDIYLKRNYKTNDRENFVGSKAETYTLADLMPAGGQSINYLSPTFTANEEVGVSWDASSNKDLKAYELLIKYDFESFEKEESIGSVVHLIEAEKRAEPGNRPVKYLYKVVDGELFINGEEVEDEGELFSADFLNTGESYTTEVHIDAYAKNNEYVGSIKLGRETAWLIQDMPKDAHTFAVSQGEVIFDFTNADKPFMHSGDSVTTGDAKALIQYGEDEEVLISEKQNFVVPKTEKAPMYVAETNLFSDANLISYKRFVTSLTAGALDEGTLIHFMEDSEISIKDGASTLMTISKPAHSFFTMPAGLSATSVVNVESGEIEVIYTETQQDEYPLQEGMAILIDDFVDVTGGEVTLSYTGSNANLKIYADQTFALASYDDPEAPEANVQLLNGSYYGQMRTVLNNNARGTSSIPLILAPQSCGDKSAPYISVGETEKEIAIFKTASVDASSSFDAAGSIVAYYSDTNLNEDTNGDGDPTNDINQFSDDTSVDLDEVCFAKNEMDNPVFNFGPYNKPGQHKVKIFAVDQSCNASGQIVTINVFVPQIYLDESSARSGYLSGHIEPAIDNMPISFIRDRNPPLELFWTESADENHKYFTNASGEFEVEDMNTKAVIAVKDSKGNEVAEADPITGDITLLDSRYRVEVLAARPPDLPTRAAVVSNEGEIMASFFIVPDLNSDTEVVENFDEDDDSVQVKIVSKSKDFFFDILPGNDPENPGASTIKYVPEDKLITLVNTSGNIFSFDDRIQLLPTNHKDKLYEIDTISIYFSGKEIAQVYIPGQNFDGDLETIPEYDLNKVDAVGTKPKVSVKSSEGSTSPFVDVDPSDPYAYAILDLASKGIVDGYLEDGKLLYKPEQLISRAEYTKILLKTLCIDPREEAYKAPSPFSDIPFNANEILWFYPFVKESFLQDFIQGYVGEKDPTTGKAPFKPGNTISQAEAATIILSALNTLEIMDLSGIEPGNPWFAPFMEISQNLIPYLKEAKANSQVFLLTEDESSDPLKQISRAEFAVMAQRVFNAYNCYTIDEDEDGMPTEWEKENGLDPYDPADAEQDPDRDQLSNLDEYKNETDPFNPDTDGGCMLDGLEVKAQFNPATNPNDDDPDFDGLSCNAESNIYKTDPFDPDTDKGGVSDGDEVLRDGTDPLVGDDDKVGLGDVSGIGDDFDDLKTELDEGVYGIEETCRVCPCPSSVSDKADIIEGDDFWAVITAPDDPYDIHRKSNAVTITEVPL